MFYIFHYESLNNIYNLHLIWCASKACTQRSEYGSFIAFQFICKWINYIQWAPFSTFSLCSRSAFSTLNIISINISWGHRATEFCLTHKWKAIYSFCFFFYFADGCSLFFFKCIYCWRRVFSMHAKYRRNDTKAREKSIWNSGELTIVVEWATNEHRQRYVCNWMHWHHHLSERQTTKKKRNSQEKRKQHEKNRKKNDDDNDEVKPANLISVLSIFLWLQCNLCLEAIYLYVRSYSNSYGVHNNVSWAYSYKCAHRALNTEQQQQLTFQLERIH